MQFSDLNLNKQLLNALESNGLVTPTTIQAKAFSPIMSGRDIIGLAQTGTGKTLAYLLPLIRLWKFTKSPFPQILIIVPTRELVTQVVETVEMLTENTNLVVGGAYGGANIKRNIAMLQDGVDMVVATPGRLLDLLKKGALKGLTIKKLVIDEVDEMLNLGFRTQLKSILDMLPEKKQSLLFSATMIDDVEDIIEEYFIGPLKIEAAPMGTPLENINQSGYKVPNFNTKVNLIKLILAQKEVYSKVLVFTATKKLADQLAVRLEEDFEDEFGVIHSNKSQNYRFGVINNFKSGAYRFILATDIVARGIDVSEVTHVINFDTPEVPENYIHRIGRTGRADRKGNAITFIRENDLEYINAIEELMDFSIPINNNPEELEVSDILTEDELPKIIMKNIVVRRKKDPESGPAFHEKKAKNLKVNSTRAERIKRRYEKKGWKKKKRK